MADLLEGFRYREGHLYCEGIALSDLAADYGTPLYVYSQAVLSDRYERVDRAFAAVPHLICYSLKANGNLSLGRHLARLGAGADVVSGGELYRALKMGIPGSRIVYSSVGKTTDEIAYALRSGILMFNVESAGELEAVEKEARLIGTRASVALRVNPDVDPGTHPYITTGMKKYKFGIPTEQVMPLYRQAASSANLDPVGIQMHLGSQLVSVAPIVEAAEKLIALVKQLAGEGINLRYLDLGGGMGIRYRDETPEGPDALARLVIPLLQGLNLTLILEPGRFIVGNAGALVARVLYVKDNGTKKFVIVDAAMNDLIRPTLYDAYHAIVPVTERRGSEKVDVVGPICESGDFFAHDRQLPPLQAGDLVAIMGAGAYGFSMASNYNARPRAAEVLVNGSSSHLVRRREKYEDLVRAEEME